VTSALAGLVRASETRGCAARRSVFRFGSFGRNAALHMPVAPSRTIPGAAVQRAAATAPVVQGPRREHLPEHPQSPSDETRLPISEMGNSCVGTWKSPKSPKQTVCTPFESRNGPEKKKEKQFALYLALDLGIPRVKGRHVFPPEGGGGAGGPVRRSGRGSGGANSATGVAVAEPEGGAHCGVLPPQRPPGPRSAQPHLQTPQRARGRHRSVGHQRRL